MKETAGTLLYRRNDKNELEVLLVHASGNYNRKSPWSIPKGQPDPLEELEAAARRETLEETGVVAGRLEFLGHVDYTKSRKRVHCFVGPLPKEARPHCASWEVDEAELIELKRAKAIIHHDQAAFLQMLEKHLADR
ncbi:MAG TPA: NUDIX domain-containing protein [Planktothrix sp.]|jgi:predicted NUDIX family NTP pyrophosphohydrolase